MDIKLGQVNISRRQFEKITDLKSDVINGFSLTGDRLTVVANRDLTDKEKEDILLSVQAIDDVEPSKEEKDKAELKEISDKKDKDITLADLIKILRYKKLI